MKRFPTSSPISPGAKARNQRGARVPVKLLNYFDRSQMGIAGKLCIFSLNSELPRFQSDKWLKIVTFKYFAFFGMAGREENAALKGKGGGKAPPRCISLAAGRPWLPLPLLQCWAPELHCPGKQECPDGVGLGAHRPWWVISP